MYAQFFGLRQEPFSIAPDPRYLFMSERHREALAHLLYGLGGGGGFVLLTGEIGAGKTTVCRCFLEQVPKRCNVAYIFNPKLTVAELMKSVCDEYRIPYVHQGPGVATIKDYTDPLNEYLLKTHAVGQNNVLIIDEAQNLSADVLEQLRLLTNLETNERKLLQIILIGQPELRSMLARPELEQLAQRVIARYHLEALSEDETRQYVHHRLEVAGMKRASPFDAKAMRRIHEVSRGVPRRVNLVCDRALLGAYANGLTRVDRKVVDKAAQEVFGGEHKPALAVRRPALAGLVGLGMVGGAALFAIATSALERGGRGAAPPPPAPEGAAVLASKAASAPSPAASAASAAALPPAAASSAAVTSELQTASLLRDEKQAWRELATAWNLRLGDGDPCQAVQRQQVLCFTTNGSLTLVRQLARPGILTLRDDKEGSGYALLTGLGPQHATLRMGGVTQTVTLTSLADRWRGEFATLWRTPPGYGDGKSAVANAPPVADWVATQLAAANREPGGGTLTERALKAKVSAFQIAQGLKPDGLAGPVTLMQLNRAAGIDEPRLLFTDP
jgi:general secretion pathway protein A